MRFVAGTAWSWTNAIGALATEGMAMRAPQPPEKGIMRWYAPG
ncbi:hypothetical protein J2S41_003990 [Catenuloplanes atrovinosus]|uniref:Uncharacterized protein n=1 Tax=Catenuloplanes atrovinosus TaxID=137266 RepID=A0AAE4CAN6_9ACTN|nr:hypothetical protein [Catenuloplanes atrovinosus]